MAVHMQRQITRLKKLILQVGTLVEENVDMAIRSVQERDPDLANLVIQRDDMIDRMEIDIEEECLHTLALNQPVAFDLRYVIAVLKMNNDLERIGDLAVNIAEVANYLTLTPRLPSVPFDFRGMVQRVRSMLKRALDSVVNVDADLAQSVRETDVEVDAIHREMYAGVCRAAQQNTEYTEQLLYMLNISKNLERIADHAVNVAEDVIYITKGELLRHGSGQVEV